MKVNIRPWRSSPAVCRNYSARLGLTGSSAVLEVSDKVGKGSRGSVCVRGGKTFSTSTPTYGPASWPWGTSPKAL